MFETLTIAINHYMCVCVREREREGTTTTCMIQFFLFVRNLVYITEIEVKQRYEKGYSFIGNSGG